MSQTVMTIMEEGSLPFCRLTKGVAMASVSLLTNANYAQYATAESSASLRQAAKTTVQTNTQDIVKLSAEAQAKLLYKEGQSVSAIATQLGTTAKVINDYLGITLQKGLQQMLQAIGAAG